MPISKMYIGQCQNWPHSDEADFLHFETLATCQGSNPNNLPGQSPNPGDGTYPFGDTGWFVSRTDTQVSQVLMDSKYYASTILWNGDVINRYWDKNSNSNDYLQWRNFKVNNNADIFRFDADYDEPLGIETGLGWMYRLDYDRDSQVPADVLTQLASSGWSAAGPVYTGCVKRIRFKHFVPDLPFPVNSSGEYRPHSNPSVDCGAPYGDGYFQGQNRTIIIADGVEVYNQPGSDGTVVVNGFKYMRQLTSYITDVDGTSYNISGYGWANDGTCGEASSPNGDNVHAYPFIKVLDV